MRWAALFGCLTLLFCLSCSKSSTSAAKVSLRRIANNATRSESLESFRDQSQATSQESDIVIDSLMQVVSMISISPGTALTAANATPLYTCSGTTDQACEVDLAKAGADQELLSQVGSAQIKTDTYTFVAVATCKDSAGAPSASQGYYVRMKVHAKFAGTWWYTTKISGNTSPALKNSGISSSSAFVAPSDYDYASLFRPGCQTYNVFQTPLALSSGQDLTVKLFFDLRQSVSVSKPGGVPSVTAWFTYLAGTIDTDKPDLQRYRLDYGGGAQVFGIYLKKGTHQPEGAYNYTFLDDAHTGSTGFSDVIKQVASTATDGTLEIHTYGGQTSTDVIDNKPGSFNTTGFTLLPAAGATGSVNFTDGSGTAKTASVTRID